MTQIDYDREMAFVAVRRIDQTEEILGVTRAISDPDNIDAEFAVLVSCRMRRERLIRPTKILPIQYIAGPRRPDKRSASGSFAFVIIL